jgi:hypothetical protein
VGPKTISRPRWKPRAARARGALVVLAVASAAMTALASAARANETVWSCANGVNHVFAPSAVFGISTPYACPGDGGETRGIRSKPLATLSLRERAPTGKPTLPPGSSSSAPRSPTESCGSTGSTTAISMAGVSTGPAAALRSRMLSPTPSLARCGLRTSAGRSSAEPTHALIRSTM